MEKEKRERHCKEREREGGGETGEREGLKYYFSVPLAALLFVNILVNNLSISVACLCSVSYLHRSLCAVLD